MLIGGDDINDDIITFSTCFSVFVYIRVRFRFALIGGNFTAQSTGRHSGIGGEIQIYLLIYLFTHFATYNKYYRKKKILRLQFSW